MAKHSDMDMFKTAIDELLDEYEAVVKNDLGPVDAKLSEDEQGDPLASQDNKGGLQPAGVGQGAPKDGMGGEPTSLGIEVKLPLKSAPAKGDGMGNDPVSNGDGAVAKADGDGKGSVPPGFKAKEDEKSAGAEDESDESEAGESEAGESEEAPEGDESEGEEGGEEGEEGGFGGQEGAEGEDGDPAMDAAVEKALYKFMAKIGMTGEMGKGEDFAKSDDLGDLDPMTLEPRIKAAEDLAKSETEALRKTFTEEISKRDAQIEQLTNLVKGLSDQIGRLAKAPAGRPKAVQGYAPLQKSEGDVEQARLSKSQLAAKAQELQKSGVIKDRFVVARIEGAPSDADAYAFAKRAGVI